MKRSLFAGAVLTVVAASAAVGFYAGRHSVVRVCEDVPCDHLAVRDKVIASQAEQASGQPTYLIIGDSYAELADWPDICGNRAINAGIGFATTET